MQLLELTAWTCSSIYVQPHGWQQHSMCMRMWFTSLIMACDSHVSEGCRFKLALANQEDRTSTLALIAATDSTSGVGGGLPIQLTPQRVIGDCLRFFQEHALRTLNSSYGNVQLQEVTWALSVPAGWSEASKRVMRLAAADAGIVDDADSL